MAAAETAPGVIGGFGVDSYGTESDAELALTGKEKPVKGKTRYILKPYPQSLRTSWPDGGAIIVNY